MLENLQVSGSDRPVRILYVITKSGMGGAGRYVRDLACAMHARGHSVAVAAGGNGPLFESVRAQGIETRIIESYQRDVSLRAEWKAFLELYRYIREYKPDVLHVNSSKAGLGVLAGRLCGIQRIVFTVHGWALNEDRPLYQRILIWLSYYATLLLSTDTIAVSEATKRQGYFPLLHSSIRVIRNGISPFSLLSRDDARKALLPGSPSGFWVGVVAELHPIKGLPTLIEAYEHAVPEMRDAHLLILGDGQMRGELERQIRLEGVSGTAHLLGTVPDAGSYMRAFDALVLPSRSEGLAYVLLEAGLASVPVIATSVGGVPEVIEDGKTGLLVPYGNRQALTEAMTYLEKNHDIRSSLAENLHRKVEEDFSLERMVSETVRVYTR